jgi:hypothetical protein
MKTLQDQLQEAENKVNDIKSKIKQEAENNKPIPIYEKITTLKEVCEHLKHEPEKDVINVNGFDEADHEVLKNIVSRMRICKVYNEGKLPAKNERWHPWHTRSSAGAGLVFNGSRYNGDGANSSSASRLSFLDKNRSDAYAENFMSVEEGIIQL